MPENNNPNAPAGATPPSVQAVLHAIDLERALTQEDYATNSEALQECMRAWAVARGEAPAAP